MSHAQENKQPSKQPNADRPHQGHRSGQEYEYGETPETGLGGAGNAGVDPAKQNARKGTPAERGRLTEEIAETRDPKSDTRQGGGSSEAQGLARCRDQHRSPVEESDMPGQQGLRPEAVEESGGRNRDR
jgi:hypothetical protein